MITKEQNQIWAYIYLGIALSMIIMGFLRDYYWFILASIMIFLAGWRLFVLGKDLKE